MPKLSKFFRVAVEGATCDGRTLDRQALQEMADAYNPSTYTARVNMEHIRGFSADPPFNAYGDVKALQTREIDLEIGGKTEKRLALFAQVEALDNLIAVQSKGQKLYPSIELNPNFAATGKAYLQGLAVTDSPASLGTEVMMFAAEQRAKNADLDPFASKKVSPGNFFTAADEAITLEFEDAPAADPNGAASLFAAATEFFRNFGKDKPVEPVKPTEPAKPGEPANDNNLNAQLGEGLEKLASAFSAGIGEVKTELASQRTELDALKASIETTDNGAPRRPAATGKGNFAATDC